LLLSYPAFGFSNPGIEGRAEQFGEGVCVCSDGLEQPVLGGSGEGLVWVVSGNCAPVFIRSDGSPPIACAVKGDGALLRGAFFIASQFGVSSVVTSTLKYYLVRAETLFFI
jgi:hypothetical protein